MPVHDLIGQRFTRLTVEQRAENDRRGSARWVCRCDCGQAKITLGVSLLSGKTRSCGCLHREALAGPCRKGQFQAQHGQSGNIARRRAATAEYRSWMAMKSRCNNPNATDYHRYGGRGIAVCDRWNSSFEAFVQDMGPRPSLSFSIDRVENDGNYEPGNCRWATPIQQQSNRVDSRFLEVGDERITMAEAARRAGIHPTLLRNRLERGWQVHDALRPPRRSHLLAPAEASK